MASKLENLFRKFGAKNFDFLNSLGYNGNMKMSKADKYLEEKINKLDKILEVHDNKINYVADFVTNDIPEILYGKLWTDRPRTAKKDGSEGSLEGSVSTPLGDLGEVKKGD